jgi:hypothetical protein
MTADAGPSPGLRSLLAQPAHRRLWIARTISQVGDVAQFTTLALLVVMLTGSASGSRRWYSWRSSRCCSSRRSQAPSSTGYRGSG